MTDVRIAVIGAGLIGREHCQLIANAAGVTLAGIADNGPAGQFIADKFKVSLFDDYRQMLDRLRPDGAIVALPNQLHAAAGIACAERGIPCLVEKP
ncbi:MAG: Gfo/Idh/MocA family oxidoreductase, partial [Pseudomonadota bacterium]|nr:Gfo/Idh/MocA family oxidoreductase [Pseudomonadota bacterium]